MNTSFPVLEKLPYGAAGFDEATQTSGYAVSRPLSPKETTARVVTAAFMVRTISYKRPAFNTRNADDPTLIFCDDSPLRDLGMGLAEFTRTWATLPPTWDDFEGYAQPYPGLGFSAPFRLPVVITTAMRIRHEYFLIGSPGGTYATPALIPLTLASFSDLTQYQFHLLPQGNFISPGSLPVHSSPDRAAYDAIVAGDISNVDRFSIQAEDSKIALYMGPIWSRVTPSVKAR